MYKGHVRSNAACLISLEEFHCVRSVGLCVQYVGCLLETFRNCAQHSCRVLPLCMK